MVNKIKTFLDKEKVPTTKVSTDNDDYVWGNGNGMGKGNGCGDVLGKGIGQGSGSGYGFVSGNGQGSGKSYRGGNHIDNFDFIKIEKNGK